MVVNFIYLELDYFEKLVILILVLLMCLICEGIKCEG